MAAAAGLPLPQHQDHHDVPQCNPTRLLNLSLGSLNKMNLTPLSVSTLYYERSHQDLCDSSLWSLLSVLNFHSLNVLSKVHVFEPSHILKRSCDKIGGQFLSSPGGLHPHGPGAVPLKVAVGPLGLYSLDPDPLPSRPCSQTCLVHFEINDLVISTEFF